ncbi:hypothetical protein AAZX31_12G080100 [Glycine max]
MESWIGGSLRKKPPLQNTKFNLESLLPTCQLDQWVFSVAFTLPRHTHTPQHQIHCIIQCFENGIGHFIWREYCFTKQMIIYFDTSIYYCIFYAIYNYNNTSLNNINLQVKFSIHNYLFILKYF